MNIVEFHSEENYRRFLHCSIFCLQDCIKRRIYWTLWFIVKEISLKQKCGNIRQQQLYMLTTKIPQTNWGYLLSDLQYLHFVSPYNLGILICYQY